MLRPKLQKIYFKALDCNRACTSLCIKLMFMAYVKNCKFVLGSTLPHINFMRHSLLELLSKTLDETYIHAFAYIRQLAIGLRKAYTSHSKEDKQAVQNWQFVESLRLWAELVAIHAGSHQLLHSLVHPLVQIIVALVKLNPGERWIPLRFHCVEMLHILSGVPTLSETSVTDKCLSVDGQKSTSLTGHALAPARRVLVPSLPLLLDTFQLVNFNRRASSASKAPIDLRLLLHFSPSQRRETASLDAIISWLIDLLTEAAAIHANSVVFPEYALPMISALKQFVHTCRVPAFTRPAKALLAKVREHSDWMKNQRRRLNSLANSDELVQFESRLSVLDDQTKISPFWAFYVNHKQIRATELAHLTKCHQKDVLADDEQSSTQYPKDRKKSGKLSASRDSSEESGDSDDSDASYDIDDGITVTHVSKSKDKHKKSDNTNGVEKPQELTTSVPAISHSKGKPVKVDENDDDSDFDLEAALNEPEQNDDSDEAAPDQVTDFELSDSDADDGNEESDGDEDLSEDVDSGDLEDDYSRPKNSKQHNTTGNRTSKLRKPFSRARASDGSKSLPRKRKNEQKAAKRPPGEHPSQLAPKKRKRSEGKQHHRKLKPKEKKR
ncbi:Nucleolar complex protein 2 [Fasciolopsis buskii]|uniref:Nucleolar complex protein 2 n=1 Tax=Fasciolopsis buskii TaxID=27845 RepID=A0A8E0RS65_9TREM|nr:Nucleolar complex protein 2 [Fasciolopsis buski]